MSKKLRVHRTALDNLVSNLRGEVGEVVTSWILWRWLRAQSLARESGSDHIDFGDRDYNLLGILQSRLYDDIVARLAELAEPKIGRLTFHFAAEKLDRFRPEVVSFDEFIKKKRFRTKRNYDIAHKELPERWDDHKNVFILRYSPEHS